MVDFGPYGCESKFLGDSAIIGAATIPATDPESCSEWIEGSLGGSETATPTAHNEGGYATP